MKPQYYLIVIKICVCSVYMHALYYSSVPNRSACTFINFEKKISPYTFIWVALKFEIKSSKLKTAYNSVKKSKLLINKSIDMSK